MSIIIFMLKCWPEANCVQWNSKYGGIKIKISSRDMKTVTWKMVQLDIISWGTGLVWQTNLYEGKGVLYIAADTVTDSCEDLSPVAVRKASAEDTPATLPDDSFSAGIRALNKVVVG